MKIAIIGMPFSGKTTLLNKLKERGVNTFNSDEYVHEIYLKGNVGYEVIKNSFGSEFVNDIEVDRKKLGNLVAKSEESMKILNERIWPLVFEKILSYDNLVYEAPILALNNDNSQNIYDKIYLLKANKIEIKKRMKKSKRLINEEFLDVIFKKWDNVNDYKNTISTDDGISQEIVDNFIKENNLKN